MPPGGLSADTPVGTQGTTLHAMERGIEANAQGLVDLRSEAVTQPVLASALGDYLKGETAERQFVRKADLAGPTIQARSENAFIFGSMLTPASGSGQFTYLANYSLDAPFVGVRLILANVATSVVTLPRMIAAPSASGSDIANPVTAAGTAQPWATVTLNGSSTIRLPASPGGGLPSYTLSDIVPIQSVPRTDSGTGYLLYTRFVTDPASWNVSFFAARTGSGSADANLVAAINGGRTAQWGYIGGDHVTQSLALTSASVSGNPGFAGGVVVGAVYYTTTRSYTLMAVGDSLTQGWQTASDYDGFARHAASALSAAGFATSYADASWTGQTTGQMQARAYALLAAGLRPSVMTIPVDSPNDYVRDTGAQSALAGAQATGQQRASALKLADYARSLGVFPILVTPLPLGLPG
ncbi:hypothetical protein [Asaia bogorensis]|uniref:hypothetical protein n=1 Tax=Asaia bogorensis TaxID=91915 RepID=UPI000EFD1EE8|nr:hypothetical protein [Asaia bogorensis]